MHMFLCVEYPEYRTSMYLKLISTCALAKGVCHLGISVLKQKNYKIYTRVHHSHMTIKWAALYCNEMDSDIENKLKTTTTSNV